VHVIIDSGSYFSLKVDGSSNVADENHLDMLEIYFSKATCNVMSAFCHAVMLGQATKEIMETAITDQLAIDGSFTEHTDHVEL
jgi:hypothetical protein